MGTETSVKEKIQQLVGGAVLLSLPLVAIGLFNGWISARDNSRELERLAVQVAKNTLFRASTELSIYELRSSISALSDKVDLNTGARTLGKRFTLDRGETLERRVDRVEQQQATHAKEAERYKEKIDRCEAYCK